MKLSEILNKRDKLIAKALKTHIEVHKSVFGTVNAKKLLKLIDKLYRSERI
jgi:hypothetical protein